MRKTFALLLILVFLTASCLILVKPTFSSSAVAVENTWTQKASMDEPRARMGAAVVNGKIYVLGGNVVTYQDHEYLELTTNEEYDPVSDTWTFKTPMPTASSQFAIAVCTNKIYCMDSGKNQVYDPATDTWENKTAMPTARTLATASVVDGKVYVIGGYPNRTLNEVYDPITDTWSTKAPMPIEQFFVASEVINNKIYIFGGYYEKGAIFTYYYSLTQIYDPATDTWKLGSPPPRESQITLFSGITTGFMAPKRIYVFAGNSNQIYDPKTDSWTYGADVPTRRGAFAVAVVDDVIYVIGGVSSTGSDPPFGSGVKTTYHATVEQYIPFGYGTPDPSYVPPDITAPEIAVASPENKTYYTTDMSLIFTVNEPVSSMRYDLDGETVNEILGNTTLNGLAYGAHNLTIYAVDRAGNTGASETICFTIAESEPFPTELAITASVASVAVIGVGLLVYFRKRKHEKEMVGSK